ncbi:uncharacterized protein LOC106173943 [Lingula anatina]|uniref:Uncharacterized protein LOC106173943 n=1 Tax=Lingula anatina TaxID=7574 RepID=A0A1S3JK40_LINAN|nr:uncharacterized protein LOC106173943 [Lingula anatina]|eukprot:XP_013410742.1 uncharacterized protein LOC106173943 [Lingula anatina]
MADDSEVFVNSKISCVSSKCVDEIISAVNDETRKIISKNVDWTDEQKERLRQRFTEIYANAFNVNIQIDYQSNSEAATDELEPINLDRRNYVNTTLLPALDQVIKRTTRSRKHCPLLCTQYLCREGKAEKKFLLYHVCYYPVCPNGKQQVEKGHVS